MNLIERALQEYGITEYAGAKHHPRILEYFAMIGHKYVKTDETAWCCAFVNFIAKIGGYEYSDKLYARSWLHFGKRSTHAPQLGDIVVFWREKRSGWKGHVGFFIRYSDDGKQIYVLGGNQNNSVCIKPYPTSRLLGVRRPTPNSTYKA